MVKDDDAYLLTVSINREFIVKVRAFWTAKIIDMKNYTISIKSDFNPDLYISHVGTNDLSLDNTLEMISNHIIDTAKSLLREKMKIIFSNIVPIGGKYKDKWVFLIKCLSLN